MEGILFDSMHSYHDFKMILSKINIPPAVVKTNYVDIPGGDGSLDLTEALGQVRYKDRECSFTFTVLPQEDFEEKKTKISNMLNGQRCKIILDKDSEYYWDGRCSVNNYQSDKNLHQIVINATVSPYKMRVIKTQQTVPAGNNVSRILVNGRKTVVPTIVATEAAKIVFNGGQYNINAGTHTLLNIQLQYGNNPVTVTSNSPVTFIYQEGDL